MGLTAEAPAPDVLPVARAGNPLLSVRDLHVHFVTSRGVVRAVEGISYDVRPGEVVALVGESGCGKSVSALSIMRLLAKPAGRVAHGEIMFEGRDLLGLSEGEMRELRGEEISMIFQEPMTSLNPVFTIGDQITETLFMHRDISRADARARAVELLQLVGMPDPERRLDQYPHQFSGGMRQRVMIAIGLACEPKLIIADEPTTALDVTIQAQILKLMKDLSRRLGIALIVITHNLGVVARYADRVNVMYAGKMIEQGTADDIFLRPRHPYTIGLLRSVPRLDKPRTNKLQTIEGLPPSLLDPPPGCRFAPRCRARLPACTAAVPPLNEVEPAHFSACIRARELAEVGPEGIGMPPPEFSTHLVKLVYRSKAELQVKDLKTHFPVARGLGSWFGRNGTVRAVDGVSFDIFPGETLGLVGESGCGKTTVGRSILRLEDPTSGQIIFDGKFIVCDEPVSALDVSIQAQIINILETLQENLNLTYLFIAHDLAVVRHISDRVAVMYLGRMMELAERDALYDDPQHPYTKALLDAVPIPDPRLERERQYRILTGEVPSPLDPPKGCVFNTRCPLASEECRHEVPQMREVKKNHYAACIKI